MSVATRRYIKWAQEQFAANGSKADLQQVLEAATRSLSSTDRYNSDVRLLRIWVQYVSIIQSGACRTAAVDTATCYFNATAEAA
jgi:hypothetical protein